jgi:hypothetical protein
MITAKDSPVLRSRYFSVTRASQVFQDEVKDWLAMADKEHGHILGRNFSQMKTLQRSIEMMADKNKPLAQLALDSTRDEFLESADKAVKLARATEFVWDYFRDKLEQRLVPQLEHCLSAADLIAHDCYRSVMEHRVADLKIPLQEKRETPLPYLEAGLWPGGQPRGAVTYRAGDEPQEFGPLKYVFAIGSGYERNKNLPIAVIELPVGLAQNIWELVVLGHEVTHDIDGDLNTLHDDLEKAVKTAVANEEEERRLCWEKWGLEVFADLTALRFMGPAYLRRCFQHLATGDVTRISKSYPYPSNYLRMLLMLTYLKDYSGSEGHVGLGQYLKAEAKTLEQTWRSLYGDPPQDHLPYIGDFDKVIDAMMNASLPALKDQDGKEHTASELVTFTNEHRIAIEDTKENLLAMVKLLPSGEEDVEKLREEAKKMVDESLLSVPGQPPEVRHVASAAYMAFQRLLKEGGGEEDVRRRMMLLNLLAQELVKAKQPKVKLAAPSWKEDDQAHMSARIDSLLDMLVPAAE